MTFESKFSTEGLIIIALATVPIVLLALNELRRRWPIKMIFDEQPYRAEGEHRLRSSATVGLGTSKLHVVLMPRAPINVKSLDIRFVGHDIFQWHNAWSPQIRVRNVEIPQWNQQAETERDRASLSSLVKEEHPLGAFIVSVRPPRLWTAGDALYVEVDVEAEAPWSGHLSIRCYGERRSYSRRRVRAVRKVRRQLTVVEISSLLARLSHGPRSAFFVVISGSVVTLKIRYKEGSADHKYPQRENYKTPADVVAAD
jgi:hypothetical protein